MTDTIEFTMQYRLPCKKHDVKLRQVQGEPMVFRMYCDICDPQIEIIASKMEVEAAGRKVMKKYAEALDNLK